MPIYPKKLHNAVMTAALLMVSASIALAQLPPTGGSMPPPTGTTTPPPTGTTTPPPTGTTTPPPTGGTTLPPIGGTTPPPTGTTTPPPTGGTTLPPTGGTTLPPTGGTTLPPTGQQGCYIPAPGMTIPAGVTVCAFSIPGTAGGGAATDSSAFFKNVSLDQLAGLGADQMKNFDPAAAGSFTAAQFGALNNAAVGAMGADLLKNLSPAAVGGMKDTQIASLKPEALKGLTPELLKNLSIDAMDGFTSGQIAQMLPTQMSGFKPEQFAKLDPSAIGGVTPDQFRALPTDLLQSMDTKKLAALDVSVIKSMEKDTLAKLDTQSIKNLDSKNLSEMLVNLDKQKLAPADVKSLLPVGWAVDDKTGKLQLPAGAEVVLRTVATAKLPEGVKMPEISDLSSGMSLGGDNFSGSVMDGMMKALDNAGLKGFDMTQANGVLHVAGTGTRTGVNLAFIPDSDSIMQAAAGTPSGVSVNAEGKYILTTPDGMQVPVIPALTSPADLLKIAPGTKVEVSKEGGTTITLPSATPLIGIPDPTVSKSTLTPGVHRQGSGANEKVTVVYQDGTAQTLKPTIQSPEEFREAAKAFPQIRSVTIGTDGIIRVDYAGQQLLLRPDFDLLPASGSTSVVKPTITPASTGVFRFTNSKGESQEFYLGG